MSIWQTKNWQQMLKKSGQVDEVFEVDNIFIEKRSIGFGEYGLFVLGVELKDINQKTYEKIIDICKKQKALFFQFETIDYSGSEIKDFYDLKKSYYKKFITPYTAVINLEDTKEDILSKMKPKGRYNIKLASKKGVEVLEVEKSLENIKKFYSLLQETTKRDGFSGNSIDYYISFLNDIKESKLLLAYCDGEIIAGGIFTYLDNLAIYYYGASSSDKKYRNLMAPYLLQWEAICIGKEKGCSIYDFLGVSSPNGSDSSLKGVTDFKKKFTSDIRDVSQSYIYINKKCKYFLLNILRKIKNIIN